jgi:hypothetical protein
VSTGTVALLVAAILVLDLVIFLRVIRPQLRKRGEAARAAARAGLKGATPLREGPARSFGEESRGVGQVRGSGHLAVTDDAIVFAMAAPARVLRIPRERVTAVGEARSFLGTAGARRVLRIDFLRDDGTPDAVAFDVGRDRDGWRAALGGA